MMQIKIFILTAVCLLNVGITYAQQSAFGDLTVEIAEFRNLKGHLLISLFNSAEDFPENEKTAYRTKKVKVTQKSEQIVFEDLPYGEYAIIFLHDENDNQDMNTNMVGIPQEGYGASNNAVNTFSAPKYDDAKFEISQASQKQSLKIFY